MTKVNSTTKGDILEERLYETLKSMIENGDFPVQEKFCEIYRKKKYPSKDRGGKDITFDVVIEVRAKGHTKPMTIYVFECKNYKRRVTGTTIAGFSKEVDGVGQNIIPTIVTTVGLQESALEFAKINKIGLIILNESSPLDWVLPRIEKVETKNKYLLLEGENYSIIGGFLGIYGDCHYRNIGDLLVGLEIIKKYRVKSDQFYVEFKTKESIHKIVSSASKNLYKGDRLDYLKLCPYLTEKYGVKFEFDMPKIIDENGAEILGKTYITQNKISISTVLSNDGGRWRFTLAHEIGHYILHRNLLKDRIDSINDNKNSLLSENENIVDNSRLEIQANIFALELLLPELSFKRVVKKYLQVERLGGFIFVDEQNCNKSNLIKAIYHISTHFGVSRTVAKARLQEFGFVSYP